MGEKYQKKWTEEEQEEIFEKQGKFTGDYMFGYALKYGDFFGRFFRGIFGDTEIVTDLTLQYSMKENLDARETRFDVYCRSESGNYYDLEMQTAKNDDLFKRSSVYCGKLTLEALKDLQRKSKDGRGTFSYGGLRDRYVVFLCMFDIEKKGFPIYMNGEGYDEMNLPFQKNGEYQIFLNLSAYEKVEDEELRNLMCYMYTGKVRGELTERIQEFVSDACKDKEWRNGCMTFAMKLDEALEEGREEGREEGIVIGMASAMKVLAKTMTLEEIAEHFNEPIENIEELLRK